jgi:hypothetical protein
VVFGVEHGVRDLFSLEHAREHFGRFDADGPDEDRLLFGVGLVISLITALNFSRRVL